MLKVLCLLSIFIYFGYFRKRNVIPSCKTVVDIVQNSRDSYFYAAWKRKGEKIKPLSNTYISGPRGS